MIKHAASLGRAALALVVLGATAFGTQPVASADPYFDCCVFCTEFEGECDIYFTCECVIDYNPWTTVETIVHVTGTGGGVDCEARELNSVSCAEEGGNYRPENVGLQCNSVESVETDPPCDGPELLCGEEVNKIVVAIQEQEAWFSHGVSSEQLVNAPQ